MARLPYADPDRVSEPIREALAVVPPLNVFRMTANAETAFRPWLAFGGALLSSLELDARLRELVILHVARLSGAEIASGMTSSTSWIPAQVLIAAARSRSM